MLTDKELQSLRNLGNEAEAAADLLVAAGAVGIRQEQQIMDQEREIQRLRAAALDALDVLDSYEAEAPAADRLRAALAGLRGLTTN